MGRSLCITGHLMLFVWAVTWDAVVWDRLEPFSVLDGFLFVALVALCVPWSVWWLAMEDSRRGADALRTLALIAAPTVWVWGGAHVWWALVVFAGFPVLASHFLRNSTVKLPGLPLRS